MPRKKVVPPEVTTRRLAPEMTIESTEETERENHLYRPVNQLDHYPPKFDIEYNWYTPESAREELRKTAEAENFQQRPTRPAQVRRWKNLIKSKRWVHFLPASPVCYDPDGIQLNGQHRFLGLSQCPDGTEAGFMEIRNVPRWMFPFFDTNSNRTLKDVFTIGGRRHGPQTPTAMKLAMRYEEFLLGKRNPGGWRHWSFVKDEHPDVDDFTARRDEIQDWYQAGDRVKKGSRLLHPATMTFAFYQSLAWPEGDEQISEFLDMLTGSESLPPYEPVRHLRKWSNQVYTNMETVQAKRETHLFLLLQTFAQTQRNTRLEAMKWAYGMPMPVPYHPDGFEVAIARIREALKDIDDDYAESS